MNNKEIYRNFCKDAEDLPLFFHSDWLDLVSGDGQWDVFLSKDKSDSIQGFFPVYFQYKYGMKLIKMPPLTPYGGPFIRMPKAIEKRTSQYSFQNKVLADLMDQIGSFSYLNLLCHPQFQWHMPLKWSGFRQTSEITYVLESLTDTMAIWEGMDSTARNKINKSASEYEISESDDLESFRFLVEQTFKRQNFKPRFDLKLIDRIYNGLKSKSQAKIFLAKDKNGKVVAGNLFVSDKYTVYNLLSGTIDSELKSGVVSLIIWQAMQSYSKSHEVFDFEGGIIPNIESFFRSFGAKQKPYSRLIKSKNKLTDIVLLLMNKI